MKNVRKLIIENTKKAHQEYLLEIEGGSAYIERAKKV